MPRRLFDFVCKNSHNTESFVDLDTKEVQCSECGEKATRIISPSRVYIDPISGDSTVATAKWARMRSEKIALEKKEKANHGS